MGSKSKVAGIILNIISFVFFALAMIPSSWGNGDSSGGPTAGFALWAYSVIFALLSVTAYTVGAFKALRSGVSGSAFQLIFSIAILLLCIYVGATLNSTCMIIWNIAFAINLVLQIVWLKN